MARIGVLCRPRVGRRVRGGDGSGRRAGAVVSSSVSGGVGGRREEGCLLRHKGLLGQCAEGCLTHPVLYPCVLPSSSHHPRMGVQEGGNSNYASGLFSPFIGDASQYVARCNGDVFRLICI